MIVTDLRTNRRLRRKRAILLILYHTGIRVSELASLERKQHTDKPLMNVKREGNHRSKSIYVSHSARVWIDDFLDHEQPLGAKTRASTALFLVARSGKTMTRQRIWDALRKLEGRSRGLMAIPLTLNRVALSIRLPRNTTAKRDGIRTLYKYLDIQDCGMWAAMPGNHSYHLVSGKQKLV